jgi:hypothetical protein
MGREDDASVARLYAKIAGIELNSSADADKSATHKNP